jgi:hypothetical protein
VFVTLGDMALKMQRLDPERRRKRLALLAELAGAKSIRNRIGLRDRLMMRDRPELRDRIALCGLSGAPAARARQLIATRRRLAG